MTRDRKRRESQDRETERSGEREFATERSEGTADVEGVAVDVETTIGSVEDLGPTRTREDAVTERVTPEPDAEAATETPSLRVAPQLEATRRDESVARTLAPAVDDRVDAPTAATVSGLSGTRREPRLSEQVEFEERERGGAGAFVADPMEAEWVALPVTDRFTPLADRGGRPESPLGESPSDDIEIRPEPGPLFDWEGGSPYTSRRPMVVVHRDPPEVPSLSFLQALLRDAYTEMVGEEPTAERVAFVANEPQVPEISRSVVTLDLRDEGWEREVRNGRPVIEREGVDVVPRLREVAETLYAGELGYLVVNVPDEWEDPLRHADFFDRLVAAIAGEAYDPDRGSDPATSDADAPALDRAGSPPVVLADPTETDPDPFFGTVGRYFGFDRGTEHREGFLTDAVPERVVAFETLQERVLRQDDWRRVAATRVRPSGEESDEHYLWKAAVVEGLVQRLYRRRGEDHESLREYHSEELFDPGGSITVATEWSPDVGPDGPTADVYVAEAPDWGAVKTFVGGLGSLHSHDLVLEVETGIGEGAHNFRAIRGTLSEYERVADMVSYVGVVVPPRLLFRGRRRAVMLAELVDSWAEVVPNVDAGLLVPRLAPGVEESGTCWGLVSAWTAIEELYGGFGTGDGSDDGDDDRGEVDGR
ncbi:hypothetical protein BRD00_04425 [Halobacteriales archaeon QS_8_69_26]|nr:MAG: hypothetical protein BRD00_04425 [Halobacteriales archaeon QS_8_69_26]